MILVFTIILGVMVVILGYTTFNLLRKNERADDVIVSQQEFINKVDEQVTFSEKRLEQIDVKGTFKSDDEIGWFFNEIKVLQKGLSQFRTNSK
jgi:hypothetical protein